MVSAREGIPRLAELVAAITPGGLRPETEAAAVSCILDGVGGAIAGFGTDAARATRTWALADFAPGGASIWWTGEQRSVPAAALANSGAASALDVDDGHPAAPGHPGAAIVPAVLAAAEAVSASREKLLTALVIGYEVAIRVGAARLTDHVGTTGHWCGQGVAAALGWLRGLDPAGIAQALAVVSAQRPVVLVDGGPPNNADGIKEGIPWATFAGAAAVDLAGAGLTGPLHALGPENYDQDVLVGNWGEDFYIETVTHKAYACCRWFHPSIDAVLSLTGEHSIAPLDVRAIHVKTFGFAAGQHNAPYPQSLEEAQYSLPFCIGVALNHGGAGLLPVDPQLLADDAVNATARLVEVEVDDEMESAYVADAGSQRSEVAIETAAGTIRCRIEESKGMIGNPMDDQELVAKLAALAAAVLDPKDQSRLVEAIKDPAVDAASLADLLRGDDREVHVGLRTSPKLKFGRLTVPGSPRGCQAEAHDDHA